ncbi:uncharacterized protein [Aegilops tauschii subsp. strangulata]|uniref:KIB1-4 beta-propeller domain-containing protein n=1 Tax=Aegilops tauschii TaxID=37682 RepID=N1QU48_AEGTA|nr:uncharacterized protein LOC109758095 [Aegilops tauschii subsp. strangulata]
MNNFAAQGNSAPALIKNLISVRQITTDNHVSVEFDPFGLSVKDYPTKAEIARFNSSVYRLLAKSPSSRARFAAICRSWRHAVAAEPRVPALPWLLLSPREEHDRTWLVHYPEDVSAMRFRPRHGAVGRYLVGAYDGGWVVSSQTPPLRIVNLFTGVEVGLSEKQRSIACPCSYHGRGDACRLIVSKIVFSETPTSDGCIMAAMTENCGIVLCRVGCPGGGWMTYGCRMLRFMDIAFCNGELYGIEGNYNKLLKFVIGVNKDGAPMVMAGYQTDVGMVKHSASGSSCKEYACYIADLHGKLTMAVINQWWPNPKPYFRVFELIDTNTWSELTSLGDHALFLGPAFSKAVHMPADRHGDVERNHIYYCSHGDVERDQTHFSLLINVHKHGNTIEIQRIEEPQIAS